MRRAILYCIVILCLVACETLPETIPVQSVSISQPTVEMIEGETVQLNATVVPENATDKSVFWSTSDAGVATVAEGAITAIKEGRAIITAKAGDKTATCTVSVQKRVIQVTSVTLNKTSLLLEKNQTETLTATVQPDDATDKTVTWSSSDATIASVDQDGKVTGLKKGEVTITAKAGEKIATCMVSVIGSNTETIVEGGEYDWD